MFSSINVTRFSLCQVIETITLATLKKNLGGGGGHATLFVQKVFG
jgi:hypothetical protein